MQIGPYQVQAELGRGGMGVVYRVLAPNGQAYALKRLHPHSQTDDQVRLQRVARELEALSRVDHPGVVRALDSGWHAGGVYIVMELVRGLSLGEKLQRGGALLPLQAAELCAEIGRTLHHLHGLGMIHRDVKPDNVLLEEGRPRLTDLGMVRLYDDREGLTQTGAAIGTPGYCAPELLAKGHAADASTRSVDVYGLGATFYALLTGQPPFSGQTPYEVAIHTLEQDPLPPSQVVSNPANSALVARFDGVCAIALAKDPGDRYTSALALAEAIEEIVEDVRAGPSAAKGALAWPLAALLATGLALAGLYAFARPDSPPSASPAPPSSASPEPSSPAPEPSPPEPEPPEPSPPEPEPPEPEPPETEPSPPAPTPARTSEAPPGFETLGLLARTAADAQARGSWRIEPGKAAHLSLQHRDPAPGVLHYLHVRRKRPEAKLRASVWVECEPQSPSAMAGIFYGRPERKDYYLVGVTSEGACFIKHRSPTGIQDRLSSATPPGPHTFGVAEVEGRLSITFDGKERMALGGAAHPQAAVGLFVLGPSVGKFRDFKLEFD